VKILDRFHSPAYFQQMLKSPNLMNDLEVRAAEAMQALLERVPAIRIEKVEEISPPDRGADFFAELTIDGRRHVLVFEVKSVGQPRHVRAGLFQLRKGADQFDPPATPVFIAPYLSPDAQALCLEFDVGFLDLVGNAHIAFDSVYIERHVDAKPPAVQRGLKSIFKPKSAQILRVLLRDPHRAWRVADLSQEAGVSLGHVSNVRADLVDREWAEITDEGLRLSQPDVLLDAWRDVYEPPAGERLSFYTTLHGQTFDAATRKALRAEEDSPNAVLASFSAAHWLAPYGRVSTQYFYADSAGLEGLRDALKLSPARSGANVVVTIPKDRGLLNDFVTPAPDVLCTSPVQTYLDLASAGERGTEAADHLRREILTW
jgi:hypothetical protein